MLLKPKLIVVGHGYFEELEVYIVGKTRKDILLLIFKELQIDVERVNIYSCAGCAEEYDIPAKY